MQLLVLLLLSFVILFLFLYCLSAKLLRSPSGSLSRIVALTNLLFHFDHRFVVFEGSDLSRCDLVIFLVAISSLLVIRCFHNLSVVVAFVEHNQFVAAVVKFCGRPSVYLSASLSASPSASPPASPYVSSSACPSASPPVNRC